MGALLELGVILVQKGEYEAAIEFLSRANELEPDNEICLSVLGSTMLKLGKCREAEATLRRSIAIKPRAAAFIYLGVALRNQQRYNEAITSYEKAIELDARSDEAMANLAVALRLCGDPDRSRIVQLLRRALELAPENPLALRELGLAVGREGRLQEAQKLIRRSLELDPTDVWSVLYAGIAHSELREPEEAERYFLEAIRRDPTLEIAYVELEKFYLDQGRNDDARRISADKVRVSNSRLVDNKDTRDSHHQT